jgi:hypothetical protein
MGACKGGFVVTRDRREYSEAYYQKNRAKIVAYHAAYYAAHREEQAEKAKKRRASDPVAHRERDARRAATKAAQWAALKMDAFNSYGGPKCACCGETLFEGLTIDHIDGSGSKHRRDTGAATPYRWLKKNNYPAGFQVLCGTCNMAKGTGDHCPHKERA